MSCDCDTITVDIGIIKHKGEIIVISSLLTPLTVEYIELQKNNQNCIDFVFFLKTLNSNF